MRVILLVDMDYFYAACEELRHPDIIGKAVVVGADPKEGSGRGVVSTANYEARKFGIHSGMPISTAYRLKSDAVFLRVDEAYYEEISKKVMAIIKEGASKFEQVSIDEAFIDISGVVSSYEEAVVYAQRLKERIATELRLPCSIGISNSKVVAKMACEAAKPNGIKLVKPEDAKGFLSPMPVEKLYGVGKKTAERLMQLGFSKIGDIADAKPMQLFDAFGAYGVEIYRYANGIDESEVEENYEVKSIGRERTFEYDTNDSKKIAGAIKAMAEEVADDVRRQGLSFKTVTLKMRYSDFSEHLKSRSIGYSTNSSEEIARSATDMFEKYADKARAIRKIGVRVSGLIKYSGQKKIADYI